MANVELWRGGWIAAVAAGVLAAGAAGQTPRMVKDLRQGPQSSQPTRFARFGEGALFVANRALQGSWLYVTDGTDEGTRPVAPLARGAVDIQDLGNGRAVFGAWDDAMGWNAWVTDGTSGGTHLLLDSFPGSTLGSAPRFTVHAGKAYFDDYWVTDGTVAGTIEIGAPRSGPPFLPVDVMEGVGARMVMHSGAQLFSTNGERGGAVLLADLPGTPFGLGVAHGEPGRPDRLLFGVPRGATSGDAPAWDLWATDGTPAGTAPLGRQFSENYAGNTAPTVGNSVGSEVYFTVYVPTGVEVWKSDGTAAGTARRLLLTTSDPRPAVDSFHRVAGRVVFRGLGYLLTADPAPGENMYLSASTLRPGPLVGVGDHVVFTTPDDSNLPTVWVSDATRAGTRMVADPRIWIPIGSTPRFTVTELGCFLYTLPTVSSQTLHWLDLDAGTLVQLATQSSNTVLTPSVPEVVAIGGGRAVFAWAGSTGLEPWMATFVNGRASAGTTAPLADLAPGTLGSSPHHLGKVGNKVMFCGTGDGGAGSPLGVSDGTETGTYFLDVPHRPSIADDTAHKPQAAGDRYYFQWSGGTAGVELYSSDGTTAGTGIVADTLPGSGHGFGDWPVASGGLTYFRQFQPPRRLWRTDGTAVGTFPITPTSGTLAVSGLHGLADLNGTLCFFDTQTQRLLRTEGTPESVAVVKSGIQPWEDTYGPVMYRAGGKLYFFARSVASAGMEPHVTDGTAEGTVLLRDINPGSGVGSDPPSGQSPWEFAGLPHGAAFVARSTGDRVWVSDGTGAGTRALAVPGASAPFGWRYRLAPLGDRAVFFAPTAEGTRIFVTDLTDEGTVAVYPPTGSGFVSPQTPVEAKGKVYFSRGEPWESDGTAAGTRPVADLAPVGSSSPRDFTPVNSRLFFVATTAEAGEELWVLDLCPADWDNSGAAEVADVFEFLGAWFAGEERADVDGAGGVGVVDIFVYLAGWFVGCG